MMCVVPQLRMKPPKSQMIFGNGRSRRRRRKNKSTAGIARYASQIETSEMMCTHPSSANQWPQRQRGTNPEVSKSQENGSFIDVSEWRSADSNGFQK